MADLSLGDAIMTLATEESAFVSGILRAQQSVRQLGERMALVQERARQLLAGGIATITGWVHDAASAESQGVKLEAALKATGGASGVTADEIKKLASDLQNVTKFEDDATVGAAAMLTRFQNIKGQTFKDVITSAADLATIMGIDLRSAMNIVGRAVNDPVRGMTQLRRAGITFSESQQLAIKRLVETGQIAQAQTIILDAVKGRFQGAAEAAGKTFEGRVAILNNQLGDLRENLGNALLPALTQLVATITPVVKVVGAWAAQHPGLVAGIIAVGGALAFLIGFMGPLATGIGLVSGALAFLAANPVVLVIAGIAALVGYLIYASLEGETFAEKMQSLGTVISFLTTGPIQLFRAALDYLTSVWKGIGIEASTWALRAQLVFLQVTAFAVSAYESIKFFFTAQLGTAFANAFTFMSDVVNNFFNATVSVFSNLTTNIGGFVTAVKNVLSGGDWNFTWQPLLDGFHAKFTELTPLAKREMSDLEKELGKQVEDIEGEINTQQVNALNERIKQENASIQKQRVDQATQAAKAAGPDIDKLAQEERDKKGKKGTKAAGASAGAQVLSGVEEVFKRIQQSALKTDNGLLKQQVDLMKEDAEDRKEALDFDERAANALESIEGKIDDEGMAS